MDIETVYVELSAAIRKLTERNETTQKISAELQIQFDLLLQILLARGDLSQGHRTVLEKLRQRAQLLTEPQLELSGDIDKYTVAVSEVDCASRMHVCHGRCCSFNPLLSRQDVQEGKVAWDIDRPYRLAKNKEGYCVYQVRESGFCGNYEYRPAGCRTYSCAGDPRIWIDFDNMIAAPMPETLITIRRTVPKP